MSNQKPTTIQSKIERKGGSLITVLKMDYKFEPNALGHHVCDVEDQAAVEVFLSKPHGFREYATVTPVVESEKAIDTPQATGADLSQAVIGVKTGSGEDQEPDQEKVSEQTGDSEESMEEAPGDESELTDEEVYAEARELYIETFGKKPHHKWDAEKLIAKIEEA